MDIEAVADVVLRTSQATVLSPNSAATSQSAVITSVDLTGLRRRHAVGLESSPGEEHSPKSKNPVWEFFASRRKQTGKGFCVLLAFETGSTMFVVDVPVENRSDEQAAYQSIRDRYYERRGKWRRYLPWTDMASVERAEIRLGGLIDAKTVVGKVCPATPQPSKDVLLQLLERWQAEIDPIGGPYCDAYFSEEQWHGPGCNFLEDPEYAVCQVQQREICKRRLANLDGQWYMSECFGNPSLAAQQKSLMLEHEEPLILAYSQFRSSCGEEAQPRDTIFHGTWIKERKLGLTGKVD